jgi:GT2 family glycosyltransferase
MTERPTRRERRNPSAALLHLLNRRYHAEWQRAEWLRNDLTAIRASRVWGVVARVVSLFRRFRPAVRPVEAPLAEHARPYHPPANPLVPAGRVGVVIPFRDHPELLRNCLRSLRAGTYRDVTVVLVDNGSTDPRTHRLLDRLREKSRYCVVAAPGPFNFPRLCNAGAAAADGCGHLVFLNNDTEVLTRDWLERLLQVAADPRVGAVGATLLYPDRTVQHAGLFPRTDGTWVHRDRGRPWDAADELHAEREVPAVTAACLCVRRAVFDAAGGFEERFPVAYNDVDFCTRLRSRGLAVVVTPHARLVHYEALSRGFTVDDAEAPPGPA